VPTGLSACPLGLQEARPLLCIHLISSGYPTTSAGMLLWTRRRGELLLLLPAIASRTRITAWCAAAAVPVKEPLSAVSIPNHAQLLYRKPTAAQHVGTLLHQQSTPFGTQVGAERTGNCSNRRQATRIIYESSTQVDSAGFWHAMHRRAIAMSGVLM